MSDYQGKKINTITLLKIKKSLRDENLKISAQNPFLKLIHGEPLGQDSTNDIYEKNLYIHNLPIPQIAPFDFSIASIQLSENDIYFSLSFFYHKALQDVIDADEINEIYDRHGNKWFPGLTLYFNDIANQYSLRWDTEYDVFIEDSLWGNFPLNEGHQIIALLKVILESS